MHINRKRQSDSQTALDAQSSAQKAKPAGRAFNARSLRRIALTCLAVLGTGGLLVLAGCPGNLENPERFDVGAGANAAGGGSSSGGSNTTVVAASACATTIFAASCTSCHSPTGGALMAGLDLSGADVANRLVNVAAMHQEVADPTMCSPAKLIDPAMPSASWLLAKVNGTQDSCGSPMPLTGAQLTPDQINCLTAFVMSEKSGASAAFMVGASAAATGTGGAATAGSGGM